VSGVRKKSSKGIPKKLVEAKEVCFTWASTGGLNPRRRDSFVSSSEEKEGEHPNIKREKRPASEGLS